MAALCDSGPLRWRAVTFTGYFFDYRNVQLLSLLKQLGLWRSTRMRRRQVIYSRPDVCTHSMKITGRPHSWFIHSVFSCSRFITFPFYSTGAAGGGGRKRARGLPPTEKLPPPLGGWMIRPVSFVIRMHIPQLLVVRIWHQQPWSELIFPGGLTNRI